MRALLLTRVILFTWMASCLQDLCVFLLSVEGSSAFGSICWWVNHDQGCANSVHTRWEARAVAGTLGYHVGWDSKEQCWTQKRKCVSLLWHPAAKFWCTKFHALNMLTKFRFWFMWEECEQILTCQLRGSGLSWRMSRNVFFRSSMVWSLSSCFQFLDHSLKIIPEANQTSNAERFEFPTMTI